jgi:hypothetical protein
MRPSTLLHVFGEIAAVRPWAVLMRGRGYWRIEDLVKTARHDEAKGMPEDKAALLARVYTWSFEDHDRIVVWRDLTEAVYKEPGAGVDI